MARPTPTAIESTGEGWDAFVDANFDLIFETPLPVAEYANFAALPSASAYDRCVAALTDEDRLVISDGTSWVRLAVEAGTVADLTDNSTGSSGGDTIAAVSSVATAADAIATLAEKVNDILTELRAGNAIDT